MTKHEAFLAQARSDYAVFTLLQAEPRTEVPQCHVLHYLQMATEKLAKAFFSRTNVAIRPRQHRAFSRLAAELSRRADVLRALGYAEPTEAIRFLDRATPVFVMIEDLCPTLANAKAQEAGMDWDQGLNVEYPWWERHPSTSESWVVPASHTYSAFQLISQRSGDGARMLTVVRRLLDNFDRIP